MASVADGPKEVPESVVARILDSMDDGVLVVDPAGAIAMCNGAARRVLGLVEDLAPGTGFGETFFLLDGLDEFTQAVLDAVGGRSEMGRKVVDIRVDGEPRSLALATSYLRAERGGGPGGAGVVAVFSDITEIAALREAEVRLGRKVEAQLAELRDAYRTVEERNEAMAATLRKARVARAVAAGAVLAVVAAAGAWLWDTDIGVADIVGTDTAVPAASREPVLWTVKAGAVRQTISVV